VGEGVRGPRFEVEHVGGTGDEGVTSRSAGASSTGSSSASITAEAWSLAEPPEVPRTIHHTKSTRAFSSRPGHSRSPPTSSRPGTPIRAGSTASRLVELVQEAMGQAPAKSPSRPGSEPGPISNLRFQIPDPIRNHEI